jgi:hypothetical protein
MKIARSFLFLLPFVWTSSNRLGGDGDPLGRQPFGNVWASASGVRELSSSTTTTESTAPDELGGSLEEAEPAGTEEAAMVEVVGGPAKPRSAEEKPSVRSLVEERGKESQMMVEDESGHSSEAEATGTSKATKVEDVGGSFAQLAAESATADDEQFGRSLVIERQDERKMDVDQLEDPDEAETAGTSEATTAEIAGSPNALLLESAVVDDEPSGRPLIGARGGETIIDLADDLGSSAEAETAGTSDTTKVEDFGGPAKQASAGSASVNKGAAQTAQKGHRTHSTLDGGYLVFMKHIQRSDPEGLSRLQTWCLKGVQYAFPIRCRHAYERAIQAYCKWSVEDYVQALRRGESGGVEIMITLCEDTRKLGVPAAGERRTEYAGSKSVHETQHQHGTSVSLRCFIACFLRCSEALG